MKIKFGLLCAVMLWFGQTTEAKNFKADNEPDSAYLFAYTTAKNNNHNGLHFAWSRDQINWFPIGNEYSWLKSDYGPWGAEKRMITPYLLPGAGGIWHCVWALNEREKVFAHAASHDLVDWGRQTYPEMNADANILQPVIHYDEHAGHYMITYTDSTAKYYKLTTKDFKNYSEATGVTSSQYRNTSISVHLPAGAATGQVYRVAWPMIENLIRTAEWQQYKNSLHDESAKDDAQRFAGLQPVKVTITVMPDKAKPISDKLMGIFFEDINYAADGGLYAELIQNRGFEYNPADKKFRDMSWNAMHSWTVKGTNASLRIDSVSPIHINNKHYAVLESQGSGSALVNAGFGGIPVKKGERYSLSLFTKQLTGRPAKLRARLVSKEGVILAESSLNVSSGSWKKGQTVLTVKDNAADATLELESGSTGSLALDMVSLFPQNTFRGRSNGLRTDLARVIADLNPRFIRFPGGCVAHGDGLENIYRWKNTIGPLEARRPQRNIWNYHQSMGLGYFEYFQFCEDIGAEPLPVIAAAVPCQNSAVGGAGQQGGVPMDQMDEYIQDILDLIDWANGPATSKWGKLRAEAGHPKPFNLKYIGIGNEDLITDIFEERFTLIYQAIREKHPEITVIGTVGPFYKGTDYEEGWEIAEKLKLPMVDEHYYESPAWFIHNQDFYDRYDRNKSKVYLGEYASRGNTFYNALAEAVYLTALERNGDVVHMASYAPLLAKEGNTQWNPDLIYFNNTEIKPTVNYEVQKLFGRHAGDEYLPGIISLSNNQEAVQKRIAYSVVRDSRTGDIVIKLVNILPVTVQTTLDNGEMKLHAQEMMRTVLRGQPEEKTANQSTDTISISGKLQVELPPYSLTVLRIGPGAIGSSQ